MNIGVFAGVFDPIHLGHTYFIEKTIKEEKLDKMYILLEQNPKFKNCLASYEHRKHMVELALADIAKAETYETKTEFFPVSSCLPEIKEANPSAQIYLLMGDDVAKHIDEWENSKQLLADVELIIAERSKDGPYARTSSLKIREQIKAGAKPMLNTAVLNYIKINRLY